ncbi:hypothetical protein RAB80_018336 [Fusarium oxysporum f. sp. vasinfectum]|nr:hypothetical protein RAB80_018336 [Fusarium oxysporum f. sp. vasinfectum]
MANQSWNSSSAEPGIVSSRGGAGCPHSSYQGIGSNEGLSLRNGGRCEMDSDRGGFGDRSGVYTDNPTVIGIEGIRTYSIRPESY